MLSSVLATVNKTQEALALLTFDFYWWQKWDIHEI